MTSEIFKCDICSKLSDTLGKFNRHLKTHSKPFRCKTCPSGFALHSDLERHFKARHRVGNDQYRCHVDQCQFQSKRKDHLKRHTRTCHSNALLSADIACIPSTIEDKGMVSEAQIDETTLTVGFPNGPCTVSVFMQAAISGDITTLDSLMGFGFSVDTRADDQSIALHCAARSGQARTVQYLLDKGASCNTFNDKRRQPLHEAILSGDSDTLKALIQYTSEGKRPCINEDTMPYLALTKNMEVFDLYAGRLGIELTATDATKMLDYAIRADNDTIVAALLEHPQIKLDEVDKQGHAPIHKAAFHGSSKVMSVMLASGRIDTSLTTRPRNLSATHVAARYGRTEIIEQMLHLVNRINYFDHNQCTALHHAAASGKLDTIALLLSKGSHNAQFRDRWDYTPLHYAAFNGHWKAVQLLLEYASPENDCDSMNKPPENEEFIKKDVVSALLNHADFCNQNIVGTGREGENLLQRAARSGDDEVTAVLLAHEKIDVNRFSSSSPALILAARRGHIEVVRLLLEHPEIDVNSREFNRDTPLVGAASRGHIEVVRLLLQHPEIDVNIKGRWNWTPLQSARRNSY